MTTRICHNCGKSYDNIVEFCPHCHAINRNYHIPSETGAQKINASRVIKLASRVIKLICVGGIGLILLAMLCGAISLCFYDPSSLNSSSSVTYPPITVDTQQKTSSSSSSAASAQVVKTTAIPQTTVAVTSSSPTLQSANDDYNFLDGMQSAIAELNPIIFASATASKNQQYSTLKTLSIELSTRAQVWYNKLAPMPVSSNLQGAKNAYLLYLSECTAIGDKLTEAMQLIQEGKVSSAEAPMNEALLHMSKATNYLNLGTNNLPTSQSVNDNQKVVYQQTAAVSTPSQVNSLGVTAAPTIQSIPSTMQIVNGNTRNPQEYIPLSIDGFSSDRGLESPIDNSLMEGGTTAITVSYDPKTNSKYFGQFEYLVIQVYGFKNENLAEKTYQEAYKCDQPLTISGKQVTYEFDKSHGQTNICWRDKNNIILVGTGPINRNSPNEQAQKGANIYAAELVIQRAP